MNKILKASLVCVLVVTICLSLTACTKYSKNIKDIDQIGISGALYESFMYTTTDEDFITEMVDIYNSLKYEKTDKAVDMMTAHEVFQFTFYSEAEVEVKFIVDKNNVFSFEAGGQAYKIVSDFDFEHVKELVDELIEAINGGT
ncbi:MAG: hypothetical protein E7513_06570 [Ruminococcaceae bacterium]|nr:hypothetical protein [Oscillospiraceae bacterium]